MEVNFNKRNSVVSQYKTYHQGAKVFWMVPRVLLRGSEWCLVC